MADETQVEKTVNAVAAVVAVAKEDFELLKAEFETLKAEFQALVSKVRSLT